MSTDLEHLDDGEEAQVAWLLESGHDTPEMSHEFRAALGKRLDAEFALLHANGSHAAPSINGSANGAAHSEVAEEEKELVEVAPERDGESGASTQRRSRRRWVISIIAAASVALTAAILSNPPAWAAAVR